MTQPGRLNQLQLVDDTALGLLLVWVYMVLDVTQRRDHGAYWLSRWIGDTSGIAHWSVWESAAQVALLLGLALVIGYVRLRRLLSRVRPGRLAEIDAALNDSATGIARRTVRRSPLFMATASLTDTNACCVLAFPRQYVIVGGGLRLLWRKAPAQAAGIVAHECMHLAKRDTLLLIGTWYTFIAYCLLLLINFALRQGYFWSTFLARVPAWQEAGLDVARGIGKNLLLINVVTLPSLLSAIVIGLVLRHMMRLREFIADEGAAQEGYRQGIVDNLVRAAQCEPLSFRLLRSFHPSASDRLARVADGAGWGRLDRIFCLACGLVIARLIHALPPPLEVSCAYSPKEQYMGKVVLGCLQNDARMWFLLAFFTAALVSMGFLIVHHAYRTVMTRRAARRYWGDTVQALAAVWGYAALGVFLGGITTTRALAATGRGLFLDGESIAGKLEWNVGLSIWISILLLQLALACGVAVRFTARRFHRSRFGRSGMLIAATLAGLLLSYPVAGILPSAAFKFGGLPRLPVMTGWESITRPVMEEVPGPAEIMLFLSGLVLSVVLLSHVWTWLRRGKPYSPSDVNAQRLLPESDRAAYEMPALAGASRAARFGWRPWALLTAALAGVAAIPLWSEPLGPQAPAPPQAFSFNYPHGDKAGIRAWTRGREGLWSERYPDGKVYSTYRETGRMRREGCDGAVVERLDFPAYKVFIPDRGCQKMWLWGRNGEGEWGFLGAMHGAD